LRVEASLYDLSNLDKVEFILTFAKARRAATVEAIANAAAAAADVADDDAIEDEDLVAAAIPAYEEASVALMKAAAATEERVAISMRTPQASASVEVFWNTIALVNALLVAALVIIITSFSVNVSFWDDLEALMKRHECDDGYRATYISFINLCYAILVTSVGALFSVFWMLLVASIKKDDRILQSKSMRSFVALLTLISLTAMFSLAIKIIRFNLINSSEICSRGYDNSITCFAFLALIYSITIIKSTWSLTHSFSLRAIALMTIILIAFLVFLVAIFRIFGLL
jgi:hypothetical protein